MDSQRLPLQLLLLVLTVAHVLDAHSGTTVTPWAVNVSQAASNKSALDYEGDKHENMMLAFANYEAYAHMCWNIFTHQMATVSNAKWCHWTAIRRPYSNLQTCLEEYAETLHYGYPNPLAEKYIVDSHRLYFFNCTLEQQLLLDPPGECFADSHLNPHLSHPFLGHSCGVEEQG
ncbi:hypothetical protein lerEdw1_017482 [Lerista edwardsae]|nr:hypothetical protein lerEdw1_017482 [Lerista edwardsae]